MGLLAATLVEIKCNFTVNSLSEDNKGEKVINTNDLILDGFVLKDGKLIMTNMEKSTITINTNGEYIYKLKYSYNTDSALYSNIMIKQGVDENGKNIYANVLDKNNQYINTSVVKIYRNTDSIVMEFGKSVNNYEDGLVITNSFVEINDISIYNVAAINWGRAIAIFSLVLSIGMLICFSYLVKEKVHWVFLIIGTFLGLSYLILIPSQKVAWDECFHFSESYKLSLTGGYYTDEIINKYCDDTKVWPLNMPQSVEEYTSLNEYLNENADWLGEKGVGEYHKSNSVRLTTLGYIVPSLGISAARLFKLDFSQMYFLGRLFNLIIYLALTFLAIRRLATCKWVMFAVALMPTPLMIATTYSRDSTMIACAFLGMSYIMSEFYESDKKISWKNYSIFLIFTGILCCIKAIYAPLLLIVWFLPRNKFKDKKTMYLMKLGIFVVCFVAFISFILPTVASDNVAGDSRGGATSTTNQLSFLLSNPVFYTKVLLREIFNKAFDYSIGTGVMGEAGHIGMTTQGIMTIAIIVFLIITDNREKRSELKLWQRGLVLLMIFGSASLIFTALYLSFTPVGNAGINGVQGRYFIPVLLPLYLIISNNKIKNDIKPVNYNYAIAIIITLMGYINVYEFFIRNMCS